MSRHVAAGTDERPIRLIVSQRALQNGLRELLVEPDAAAVGRVRRHPTAVAREYLIDDLQLSREVPNGRTRPPLDDWCLVAMASGPDTLDNLLERIHLPSAQLLVLLLIARDDRGQLSATIHSHGKTERVDEVRFIGPGMITVAERTRLGTPDDAWSAERWSRTTGALGETVTRRLRQATVTLVGAGRTGSQLAFQLSALGVGRLGIIDPDVLAITNLDAMPGVTPADVGLPKACALAQRLLEFRPDMAVTWLAQSVKDTDAWELVHRRADLLATCVDDNLPRLAVAVAACQTQTVHLDVACSVQRDDKGDLEIFADVRLLLPGQGCAACVGPMAGLEDAAYALAAPAGSLSKGRSLEWFEQRAGSLVTINSVAIGTAGQLWLDLLAGKLAGSTWSRFVWFAGAGWSVENAGVDVSDACRICRT